jgi:hypothetical protein
MRELSPLSVYESDRLMSAELISGAQFGALSIFGISEALNWQVLPEYPPQVRVL